MKKKTKKKYCECPVCGSADTKGISKSRMKCNRCKAHFGEHITPKYQVTANAQPKNIPLESDAVHGKFGHSILDKQFRARFAGNTTAKWRG